MLGCEGFAEPQAAQNLDSLSRIPYGNPTTNEARVLKGSDPPDYEGRKGSAPQVIVIYNYNIIIVGFSLHSFYLYELLGQSP